MDTATPRPTVKLASARGTFKHISFLRFLLLWSEQVVFLQLWGVDIQRSTRSCHLPGWHVCCILISAQDRSDVSECFLAPLDVQQMCENHHGPSRIGPILCLSQRRARLQQAQVHIFRFLF